MKKITGVMVYYYIVCERKLWFFAKNLNMEQDSDLVGIGKLLDETTYKREKRNILIDENINIDFIKEWNIIHEVKKSRKIEEASKWQLRYYIWLLKNNGIDIEKGIIDYPLLRKRESVVLEEDDEMKLKDILKEINKIMLLELPPKASKKSICKKCAYYEFCYI